MVKAQAAPAHRLILFLQQSSVEWASSLWLNVVQEVDPNFQRTVRGARAWELPGWALVLGDGTLVGLLVFGGFVAWGFKLSTTYMFCPTGFKLTLVALGVSPALTSGPGPLADICCQQVRQPHEGIRREVGCG